MILIPFENELVAVSSNADVPLCIESILSSCPQLTYIGEQWMRIHDNNEKQSTLTF